MMSPQQTRIDQLEAVIQTKFGGERGKCADAAGIQRPNLTAMLCGRKPFGDKIARQIEERLSLPPMFLDGLGDAQVALARMINSLPEESQRKIRHWVEIEAANARHASREQLLRLKLKESSGD